MVSILYKHSKQQWSYAVFWTSSVIIIPEYVRNGTFFVWKQPVFILVKYLPETSQTSATFLSFPKIRNSEFVINPFLFLIILTIIYPNIASIFFQKHCEISLSDSQVKWLTAIGEVLILWCLCFISYMHKCQLYQLFWLSPVHGKSETFSFILFSAVFGAYTALSYEFVTWIDAGI